MISSTSNTDKTTRTDAISISGQPGSKTPVIRPDHFSSERTAYLKAALERHPAIRPEVVERARKLYADPAYPSVSTMREVARQILAAPDLSEGQA